ncbi:hypothetical protein PCL_01501 [Purpureocillium lilacinum]|uniref:Uncharacterized protein n=1 Tax=Purpureocillium lilacinum TaxID=33203 RepID=A0A2U3E3Q8_PURLI|nr:hypothetical protein PCL_01501 [Purpureocillium lilacinum]
MRGMWTPSPSRQVTLPHASVLPGERAAAASAPIEENYTAATAPLASKAACRPGDWDWGEGPEEAASGFPLAGAAPVLAGGLSRAPPRASTARPGQRYSPPVPPLGPPDWGAVSNLYGAPWRCPSTRPVGKVCWLIRSSSPSSTATLKVHAWQGTPVLSAVSDARRSPVSETAGSSHHQRPSAHVPRLSVPAVVKGVVIPDSLMLGTAVYCKLACVCPPPETTIDYIRPCRCIS